MFIKNYAYFILFLSILFSCQTDKTKSRKNVNKQNNEEIPIAIGKRNMVVPLVFKANSQAEEERTWRTIEVELDFKIGGIDDTTFALPTQIGIDEKENLYILDIKDYSVKKFDSAGLFQYKFGRKGKGPGEFISPFRIDVLAEDKIVVADLNLKKITVFLDKDRFEYVSILGPIDVSFISDDEVVILQMLNPIDNSCIQKINYKNNQIEDFDNIIDVENINDQILGILPFLAGDIHKSDNGNIVYIPNVLNYLICFTKDGKVKKVYNTIDRADNLTTEVKSFNIAKFPHPKKFITSNSGIFDNTLFLVSNLATQNENAYVVDFYSMDEFVYQYSIRLKEIEELVDIKFTNKKIISLNRMTEVEVFNYQIIEED